MKDGGRWRWFRMGGGGWIWGKLVEVDESGWRWLTVGGGG